MTQMDHAHPVRCGKMTRINGTSPGGHRDSFEAPRLIGQPGYEQFRH